MQDQTTIDDAMQLPDGWSLARLGDICEVVTGGTPLRSESRFYGGNIPWIKPDDLDRSQYVDKSAEYLTEEGGKVSRLLPSGSVLVSCIGNIGKIGIAARTLATNQQINSLIPSEKIDSLFLYFVCKSIKSKLISESSISLISILNKSSFSNIKIPVPPTIEKQRRIASILDEQMKAVEQARLAVEEQLKAATRLPKAYLRSVFESSEAGNFENKKLGQFISEFRNGFGRRPQGKEQGKTVLRIADVSRGFIDLSDTRQVAMSDSEFSKYKIHKNDVLFVRVNGSSHLVGRCIAVNQDMDDIAFNDHLIRVKFNNLIDTQFIEAACSSPSVRQYIVERASTSAGQLTVNQEILSSIEVRIPPIKEQREIAVRLMEQMNAVEKLKESLIGEINAINNLGSASLRVAFSGQI